KNFSAARDAYEKVLSINGNFVIALNNLALIYSEQLGQLDRAYDLAKKAREAAPNEPHIADTFGWISYKRGNYRGALPQLQESAAKLPNEAEIQYHLGMAYYMLGDADMSRTALQKALESGAGFAQKEDAQQRLTILTMDTHKPSDEARTQLEGFLRQRPK